MIHPHPSAPDGSVTTLETYTPDAFTPTSATLCRNTAPIIQHAFGLIQRGVGCRVLGREIGTSLTALVKACKTTDMDELESRLIQRRNREVARANAKGDTRGAAALEDKFDCLNIFLQNNETVEDVVRSIETLFDERRRGLHTLATIHKAKGLEWPTVFLLDFDLLPSKWSTQGWQRQQERNLQYVAVTRAKLHLHFVQSGRWAKPAPTVEPQLSCDTSADNQYGEQ